MSPRLPGTFREPSGAMRPLAQTPTRVMLPLRRLALAHQRQRRRIFVVIALAGQLAIGGVALAFVGQDGPRPDRLRPTAVSSPHSAPVPAPAAFPTQPPSDPLRAKPHQPDQHNSRPRQRATPLSDQKRGLFWLREAGRRARRSQISGALEAYDRANQLLPHSPEPCLRAAKLLLARGWKQDDRLAQYASCARTRAPKRPLPYLLEGVAHQLRGNADQAAQLYDTFSKKVPRHPRAWEAAYVGAHIHQPTPQ